MNKSYRSLWNPALGAWIAVPEIVASRGRRTRSRKGLRAAVAMAVLMSSGAATLAVPLVVDESNSSPASPFVISGVQAAPAGTTGTSTTNGAAGTAGTAAMDASILMGGTAATPAALAVGAGATVGGGNGGDGGSSVASDLVINSSGGPASSGSVTALGGGAGGDASVGIHASGSSAALAIDGRVLGGRGGNGGDSVARTQAGSSAPTWATPTSDVDAGSATGGVAGQGGRGAAALLIDGSAAVVANGSTGQIVGGDGGQGGSSRVYSAADTQSGNASGSARAGDAIGGVGGAGGAAGVGLSVAGAGVAITNAGAIAGGTGGAGGQGAAYNHVTAEGYYVQGRSGDVGGLLGGAGGAGGSGGAGIAVGGQDVRLINATTGAIAGGAGGAGGEVRLGNDYLDDRVGNADLSGSAGSGDLTRQAGTGGTGGAGGQGGVGLQVDGVGTALTNSGRIVGGDGGAGGQSIANERSFNLATSRFISRTGIIDHAGVDGGAGGAGGRGGAAVEVSASGADFQHSGTLVGGHGGAGGDRIHTSTLNTQSIIQLVGTVQSGELNLGQVAIGAGGVGGEGGAGLLGTGSTTVLGIAEGASVQGGAGGAGGASVLVQRLISNATSASPDNGSVLIAGAIHATGWSNSGGGQGGDGGSAVILAGSGATVNNAGLLVGGPGGDGGASAIQVEYSRTTSVGFTTTSEPVSVGSIAPGAGGAGGRGGDGLVLAGSDNRAVNTASGRMVGGTGGAGGYSGQNLTINGASPVETPGVQGAAGEGGRGASMSGTWARLDNAGTLVGGQGGASSSLTTTTNPAPVYSADGTTVAFLTVRETAPVGAAGNGGAGAAMGGNDNVLVNTGRIVGGAGGANTGVVETSTDVYSLPTYRLLGTTVTSAPSAATGAPGAGGAGVLVDGQRNTLVNAGSIEGGLSTDGATRANAVLVSGNGNTVELRSGYSFVGNVVSTGAGNTLALGGAVNDSFDVSRVVTQLDGSAPVQYTGFERFLKKDASTWTLTGSTAALTPWTVAGGTLAISSDASLGAPGGTLTLDGGTLQATASIDSARPVIVGAAGGTWLTDAGTTSTVSGAIDGTGALVKTGSGRLNYTGVGTLSGPTTVADGRLAVNGSLARSAITVGSGATLAGNGTVGATLVAAGGTIAPGNSIGTLTVNGNFVQAAGSTYQVEVAPGSNVSDRIQVVGRATIDSGATLNVARTSNGNFALDTRYTVVSADGGVNGVYTLTGDTFAFVQLEDTYDANHVYLTAVQKRRFVDAGGTPNEVATAGALDLQPVRNPLTNALAWLPNDNAARHAFDQLSGELHASVKTGLLEDSRFVREASNDRLLGVFCAPGASDQVRRQPGARESGDDACMPSADLTAWGRVFGSTGHMRGDGNAARLDRDIGGFFVGADAGLDGGWRVGALGGFSRSDFSVDARQSSAKADSYTLGVYGGNRWGATSLRLGASYTWHKFNTQRSVSIPGYVDALSAKYDASTAQVYGELGHRLDIGTQVAVEPFAGLAHVKVNTDRFVERGSFAALHGGGSGADATFGTLGARFTAQVSDSTRLRATLGWRHAFGNITPSSTHALVGGLPFTVSGVPLASNVGVVEAGLETLLKPGLKLSAAYNGQFGRGVRDNGVKIGLDWKF